MVFLYLFLIQKEQKKKAQKTSQWKLGVGEYIHEIQRISRRSQELAYFEEDYPHKWFLHRSIPLRNGKWLKEYKYDDFNPSSDSLFTIENLTEDGYVYKFSIPKYFDGMSLELVAYDKERDIIELHTKDYYGNYIYGWDYDENIPEFKKVLYGTQR